MTQKKSKIDLLINRWMLKWVRQAGLEPARVSGQRGLQPIPSRSRLPVSPLPHVSGDTPRGVVSGHNPNLTKPVEAKKGGLCFRAAEPARY